MRPFSFLISATAWPLCLPLRLAFCQLIVRASFAFAPEQERSWARVIFGNGGAAEALAERTRARIAPSTTTIAALHFKSEIPWVSPLLPAWELQQIGGSSIRA